MKQEKKEMLLMIGEGTIIICLIIVTALFLSQIPIQEERFYTEACAELGGSITFYECFNSPNGFCDVDTTKKGVYCILENGTEVNLGERFA